MKRSTILERTIKQIIEDFDIETNIVELDILGGKEQTVGLALLEFEPRCDLFREQKIGEVSIFNAKGDFLPNVSKCVEMYMFEHIQNLNSESESEWYSEASFRQRKDRMSDLMADMV